MEDRYPYIGETIQVTQDMCDLNGHMNVVFYVHIFEHGSLNFYHDLGFSSEYFSEGFSNFTLEMNVKYIKELYETNRKLSHKQISNNFEMEFKRKISPTIVSKIIKGIY